MNKEEFNEWLDKAPITYYIIRIAYRHRYEEHYTISNELLYYEDGMWTWEFDWWEGEEDIIYLGYVSLDSLSPDVFKKLGGD